MRKWLLEQELLIGHNISRWDALHLERVLGIKIKAKLVDTLALSWYLWDSRKTHNLEDWGEELGIPKPEIKDWENLQLEEYVNRCSEDVKITSLLWNKCADYLSRIYSVDVSEAVNLPIVSYLSFKLDCAREQERSGWKIDLEKAQANLAKLEKVAEEKVDILKAVMPKVKKFRQVDPPAKPFKKDGTLSATGVKWRKYLSDQGLTFDHSIPIYVFTHEEEPNPNSHIQIKDWLFSLGWEPITFKYDREENGKLRPIPQVKKLMDPEFCESVVALYEKEPQLEHLEGLSIINHRISTLKGLLEKQEDGFVKAEISGLTNTLRFKHTKPCVNLPGKGKLFWKEIRECFIAREGYDLVGSDMTALEDLTKRHYIQPYDPKFVEEMSHPNYDPHISLASYAGAIPRFDLDDSETIKSFKKLYDRERQEYKKVNYSALYDVKAPRLSRELKITEKKAKKLLDDFWAKNWSVKKVAEAQKVIVVMGQKWLYNPVSGFYYSLREEKDRFSTLNQSTGVYCFDKWISYIRSKRPQLTAQFHDEIVLEIKEGYFEKAKELLTWAIDKVNEELKLNVTLSIDVKSGKDYSCVH